MLVQWYRKNGSFIKLIKVQCTKTVGSMDLAPAQISRYLSLPCSLAISVEEAQESVWGKTSQRTWSLRLRLWLRFRSKEAAWRALHTAWYGSQIRFECVCASWRFRLQGHWQGESWGNCCPVAPSHIWSTCKWQKPCLSLVQGRNLSPITLLCRHWFVYHSRTLPRSLSPFSLHLSLRNSLGSFIRSICLSLSLPLICPPSPPDSRLFSVLKRFKVASLLS